MNLIEAVKDKVVYGVHDSDLDGVSCRLLTEFYVAPNCKDYIPLNTAERDMRDFSWRDAERSDIIIFTDIAPSSLEMYEKLKEMGKEVWIFDHHITAREYLGELEHYIFDDSKCGTKILYDHITEGKRKAKLIQDYVILVDTYDMWKDTDPLWHHAKGLHNCLMGSINWFARVPDTYRSNKFLDKQHKKFSERSQQNYFFDIYEQAIIKKANEKEEKNYRTAKKNLKKRVDSKGNTYIFTECVSKVSFVASRLLKEYKDIDYIAIRATFVKNSFKLSLRSKNGFQVDAIAKNYGGGGHQAASGMELTEEQYHDFKFGKTHLI